MFGYLSEKILGLVSSFGFKQTISEENINKAVSILQEILIGSDVPFKVTKKLCDEIRHDLADIKKNSKISFDDRLKTLLYNSLLNLMGGKENNTEKPFALSKKAIFLLSGLQGSGKTTTIAKLSNFFKKENKNCKIICSSVDFVRPAAVEQLKILSQKVGIDFFEPINKDWQETIIAVKKKFKDENYDILFIDTPGRQQVNSLLMKELQEINLLLEPTFKFLVIDSMTGQESLNVAKVFNDTIEIDGAVLSKTDSDSKGGAAVAFYSELKKPIIFMGTGENINDLEPFIPSRVASRIMGSGDITTLIEKIEKEISEEGRSDHKKMEEKFLQGKSDLQDFLSQLEFISSFGSVQKLLGYLPGVGNIANLSNKIVDVEQDIKS